MCIWDMHMIRLNRLSYTVQAVSTHPDPKPNRWQLVDLEDTLGLSPSVCYFVDHLRGVWRGHVTTPSMAA